MPATRARSASRIIAVISSSSSAYGGSANTTSYSPPSGRRTRCSTPGRPRWWRRTRPQRGDIGAQHPSGPRIGLDQQHVRGAAGGRFQPDRATAGEQVEEPPSVQDISGVQRAEQGLAYAIGGGARVGAVGRRKSTAAVGARDDPAHIASDRVMPRTQVAVEAQRRTAITPCSGIRRARRRPAPRSKP